MGAVIIFPTPSNSLEAKLNLLRLIVYIWMINKTQCESYKTAMFIFNKTVHDTIALAREPRTNTLRTAENDRHVTFFKEIPGGYLIKEGHVVSDV